VFFLKSFLFEPGKAIGYVIVSLSVSLTVHAVTFRAQELQRGAERGDLRFREVARQVAVLTKAPTHFEYA